MLPDPRKGMGQARGTDMPTRMRLLKGATALLYIGPPFAGMGEFGWGLVVLGDLRRLADDPASRTMALDAR